MDLEQLGKMSERFGAGMLEIAAFGLAIGLLEVLFPLVRGQKLRRRFLHQDIFYSAQNLLVGWLANSGTVWLSMVAMGALGLLAYNPVAAGYSGYGPLAGQPFWLQVVECLLLRDLLGYWVHRWFHLGWFWKFHAIHHMPRELDWITGNRFHALNYVPIRARTIVLFVAGFHPLAIVSFYPFYTFITLLSHANLPWTFGPCRYLLVSPIFHRWHHVKDHEARDKNFAAIFPLWDLLFGTWYFPAGRVPGELGVSDPVPDSLAGQFAFPFRREARAGLASAGKEAQEAAQGS